MLLTTIGYEGANIHGFFEVLTTNDVVTIVDIRELPISRKPGFSKSALSTNALAYNLQYHHIPALGCPKVIRHDYRKDRDWDRYTQRFLRYLKTQNEAIEALAELLQENLCCLLCYEANHFHCHRHYVAEALCRCLGTELSVKHLDLQETMIKVWLKPSADTRHQ